MRGTNERPRRAAGAKVRPEQGMPRSRPVLPRGTGPQDLAAPTSRCRYCGLLQTKDGPCPRLG